MLQPAVWLVEARRGHLVEVALVKGLGGEVAQLAAALAREYALGERRHAGGLLVREVEQRAPLAFPGALSFPLLRGDVEAITRLGRLLERLIA